MELLNIIGLILASIVNVLAIIGFFVRTREDLQSLFSLSPLTIQKIKILPEEFYAYIFVSVTWGLVVMVIDWVVQPYGPTYNDSEMKQLVGFMLIPSVGFAFVYAIRFFRRTTKLVK